MMADDTSIDGEAIYLALAERLRRSVREGGYKPGQLIGSEHELARRENISRMTVRRAIELLVNEGLLERRPGKGLFVSQGVTSTRVIQVIVGNLRWDPCMQIARGVQVAAREAGIQVQLYDAHGDAELDLQVVRQLPSSPACGAIIVSLHNDAFNEAVYGLKAQGFPCVLVDEQLQGIDVSSVMADNYSGGYQAGQALLKAGHQRIAFIGDLVASTVRDRLNGLRDAIGDCHVAFDRGLVCDLVVDKDRLGDWSARVETSIRDVMGRPNPPTAIFCSCDAVARSAYRALAALELSVPGDISIAGFDDDPLAEWLTPRLTSVRQPFEQMGREAFALLSRRISDPASPAEHRVLPVELISRASISAPAGSSDATKPDSHQRTSNSHDLAKVAT